MGKRLTTKEERKQILKELNLTKAEMESIWEELCKVNKKAKELSDLGKTWKDFSYSTIKEIPKLLQLKKDANVENKNEENNIVKENNIVTVDRKEEKDYLFKIDNGICLSESELKYLVFNYSIEDIEGDSSRWTKHMDTVVELNGRMFMIPWESELTENQENDFYEQPKEVKLIVSKEYVEQKHWVDIDQYEEQKKNIGEKSTTYVSKNELLNIFEEIFSSKDCVLNYNNVVDFLLNFENESIDALRQKYTEHQINFETEENIEEEYDTLF